MKRRFDIVSGRSTVEPDGCEVQYTLKSLETEAQYTITFKAPSSVVLEDAMAALDAVQVILINAAVKIGVKAD